MKPEPYTTRQLENLLEQRYPYDQGYALFFEVPDGTGANKRRSADAIMHGLWANRGLYMTGFEIKSHRSDFLREMKNPEKAESLIRFCKYWYLVAPDGVYNPDTDTVPQPWGILTPKDGKLKETRKPEQLDPITPTAAFMASIFRCAYKRLEPEDWVHKEDLEQTIRDRADEQTKREMKRLEHMLDNAREHIRRMEESVVAHKELHAALEDGFGMKLPDPNHPWSTNPFLKTLKMLQKHGADAVVDRLRRTSGQMMEAASKVGVMLGEIEEAATCLKK